MNFVALRMLTGDRAKYFGLVFAIVIGTAGGFVFDWLKMPLAWMLGACVFSTVAAFAGLRIGMNVRF